MIKKLNKYFEEVLCTFFLSVVFVSVITQTVTSQQVVPIDLAEIEETTEESQDLTAKDDVPAVYEYEPSEQDILAELLPNNLKTQIFRAL